MMLSQQQGDNMDNKRKKEIMNKLSKIMVPVTLNFGKTLDDQVGVMFLDKDRISEELLSKARFEPGIKVLEFVEKKDGTKVIKKAELLELSIVFDNKKRE